MSKFIYADNAATTKISEQAFNAMLPYLEDEYGNPSTLYGKGRQAKIALEKAREQVADLIGANPQEIIFTSGGTESDNTALRGIMTGKAAKGRKKLIISSIEHHAILYTADDLKKQGFTVEVLPVDSFGKISLEQLERAIDDDTALVSIMAANNEIGTIQPIAEIGEICHKHGVIFHTDAVQAAGHIPLDVNKMNIDLLSMSSHKINGPKGAGALYIRKGIAVAPLLTGGGQERKMRSGTENVAAIVGFGQAALIAKRHMPEETIRLCAMRDKLIERVLKEVPYSALTGHPTDRLPGTASFTIECIEGESLVLMLDMHGVCASTGSACSTGSLDPSHVLMAIGLPHEIAHGSLRISLGMFNQGADVDYIVDAIKEVAEKLRAMSPLWEEKLQQAGKK